MKAYHYRGAAPRMPVVPVRLEPVVRLPGAPVWPPKDRAYGGPPTGPLQRFLHPVPIAGRLLTPVILLAVLLGAVALYSDALLLLARAPLFVQNSNLTLGDLVLPLTWTAVHLTNRRYGANYAVGQVVGGLVLVALVALIDPYGVDGWVGATPALSSRALVAFALSFLLANSVAIILFDAVRGPQWWRAPLRGSFAASLVFSLVYYPMGFAGEDAGWANSALVHFALFFGESLMLLAPYGLLRPAMRPLHGMNGY